MDAGEIMVKITQMREAASTIGGSANRIIDSIEAVETEVRALGPERFMSIGAEAFRAEYNRLTPVLRDTFQNLVAFEEKLNNAADDIEMASRPLR